jgi:hypothetical protein
MSNSNTEVIDEVSKWTVGLGTLILALAPLSLPFLILTAAALLPLVLPVLALGLVAAVVAAPILLVRRLLAGRPERHRAVPVPSSAGTAEPGRP